MVGQLIFVEGRKNRKVAASQGIVSLVVPMDLEQIPAAVYSFERNIGNADTSLFA